MWRLAHLVGAGSRERVDEELWHNPIRWQPALRGTFNPASALVESAPELPKRRASKRQRYDPSDPCASSGERAVLMGTTHGLSANGFAAVARCQQSRRRSAVVRHVSPGGGGRCRAVVAQPQASERSVSEVRG